MVQVLVSPYGSMKRVLRVQDLGFKVSGLMEVSATVGALQKVLIDAPQTPHSTPRICSGEAAIIPEDGCSQASVFSEWFIIFWVPFNKVYQQGNKIPRS